MFELPASESAYPNADSYRTPIKRFRWQIIPATLQLIFGVVGLIANPMIAYGIWQRHALGFETYLESDVPFWCVYIAGVGTVCAILMLVGAIEWIRCHNKKALIITVAALTGCTISQYWITARFPGL